MQKVPFSVDERIFYSLSFDYLSNWIACSSDLDTIHIFLVDKSSLGIADENENDTASVNNESNDLSSLDDENKDFENNELGFA